MPFSKFQICCSDSPFYQFQNIHSFGYFFLLIFISIHSHHAQGQSKTDHPASDEENGQKEQDKPGGDAGLSKAWALAQTLRTCATGEDISWHDPLHKAVSPYYLMSL